MIERITDIAEKIGFIGAMFVSGYLGYVGEYDAAILFAVWGLILMLMNSAAFYDDEDIDFYV